MSIFYKSAGLLMTGLFLVLSVSAHSAEYKYRARKRLCSDVVCPLENEATAFFMPSSFTDLTNQPLNAEVVSDLVEVNGFDSTARVWVDGNDKASIRVEGGVWKRMVDVRAGQRVQLKLTTSPYPGRTISAIAKVGSKSAGWDVTTVGGTVVAFSGPFNDAIDQTENTTILSNEVTISYTGASQTAGVSGGTSSCLVVNLVGACLASQSVMPGDTLQLRTRTPGTPGTSATVRLTVGASYQDWFVKTAGEAGVAYSSAFVPLAGQLENDQVASNTVTVIGGFAGTVAAAVAGEGNPQMAVNGGAWSGQGQVASGDTVALRVTTADTELTSRAVTLTAGGVATGWTVETGSPTVVFSNDFTDLEGQDRNIALESDGVTVSGFPGTLTASVAGDGVPAISVNGGAWGATASVTSGDVITVRVTSPVTGGATGTAKVMVGSSFQDWIVLTGAGGGSCSVLPSWSSVRSELVSSRNAGVSGAVSLGVIPASSGWVSAVLADNGKLYAVPYSASGILEIDPAAGTATKFGSVGGGVSYMGGVLGPDCHVYMAPYGAGNFIDLDPETKTYTLFGSVGSGRFWGSVLGRNGVMHVFPAFFGPTEILRINLETKDIARTKVGSGFSEGVLSPTGAIYSFPYYGSTKILKYDPVTNVAGTIATNKTKTYGWAAGVVAPNGKIYSCPSMEANIIELDPASDSISYIPLPANAVGNYYGWESCALAPNGKVYYAPSYSRGPGVLELDPETKAITVIDIPSSLPQYGWEGMTLASDGKLYAIPRFTNKILVIDVHANRMWGNGVEKSAYFNKGGN